MTEPDDPMGTDWVRTIRSPRPVSPAAWWRCARRGDIWWPGKTFTIGLSNEEMPIPPGTDPEERRTSICRVCGQWLPTIRTVAQTPEGVIEVLDGCSCEDDLNPISRAAVQAAKVTGHPFGYKKRSSRYD